MKLVNILILASALLTSTMAMGFENIRLTITYPETININANYQAFYKATKVVWSCQKLKILPGFKFRWIQKELTKKKKVKNIENSLFNVVIPKTIEHKCEYIRDNVSNKLNISIPGLKNRSHQFSITETENDQLDVQIIGAEIFEKKAIIL